LNNIVQFSEEELITLLQNKDEKAFNYLFDNYSGSLYGLILKTVVESIYADEVIQDVFMKVWKNIGQYDASKGRLYTWMINIARNTAIDFLKSKAYQNEQKNQSLSNFVNREETVNLSDRMANVSENNTDLIGMSAVINGLKPEWNELIQLAYFQGYSQSEIAERLDIPIGTVKTRTRNAMIELKKLLIDYQ
jgi:RNA polymerase sigma factor (sigma-70 family)